MALEIHLVERLELTILMAYMPAIYGMLLSGNKKIKLEVEEKIKFTILNYNDPKSQILC